MLRESWSDIRFRLRALFRRNAMEHELDEEVRFHLDREIEKLTRAGVPHGEASRCARVAFGGVERIKEDSRDSRGVRMLEHVLHDLRYAVRGIQRRPGFSLAIVLTLGLGIGANATMFAVTDRLLLRPPELLRDPDLVHRVYIATTQDGRERMQGWYQYTRYLDLRRLTSSFAVVAARATPHLAVGSGEDARELPVGAVSVSFFSLFNAHPVLGRFFTAGEDTVPRGAAVAVLSHAYWQSHYGGERSALGRRLLVGKSVYTIVGVAPPGLAGVDLGETPVVWVPITAYAATMGTPTDASTYYTTYNWGWMQMFVRRSSGVSPEAATADLTNAMQRSYANELALHPRTTPADSARPRAIAAPIQVARGPDAGAEPKVLLWVTGVSFIVLLIACANVANRGGNRDRRHGHPACALPARRHGALGAD
ncbi:MAG: ABC transporter permease [Gemmatimonadaceae bacterium]